MKRIATAIYGNKNDKPLTSARIRAFRKKILDYHYDNGRNLPWRKTRNPYRILLSEIMLQQTQVERVLEKYEEFLAAFPDFPTLARAPLRKILRVWQGMGYNRRALSLRALAQKVVNEHRGKLPSEHGKLLALPGIGKYTAGAILAFVFNKPVVFMDTNIRRVFIHEFYHDRESVHDEEIIPLVERTLDTGDPRQWYNALMDYGTMLRKEWVNPNRKSAHYTRQSPFENSNRQVRGRILRMLVAESPLTAARVVEKTGMDAKRVQKNLVDLRREGFIRKKGGTYFI
jgi:A/G-specific adenine glycosylase